jgi:hypothetical protein
MTLLGHPIYRRLIVFPLGLLTTAVILGLCLATIQNAPGAVHTQEFADIRT